MRGRGPSVIGDDACPLEGDACTAHCGAIRGACIDSATGCLVPGELVACSRIEYAITDGSSACSVRIDTGALCAFGGIAPTEPGYVGWAPCTEEQAELAFSALPCGAR